MIDEPVEEGGRRRFHPGLITFLALAQHNFIPFFPFRDHLGDERGRVLKIGVEQHGGFAVRMVETSRDGLFLAEVAAEADEFDARVTRTIANELGVGIVLAAIIHSDDFPVRRYGFKDGQNHFEECIDHRRFVIHRHDDGKQRL